MVIIIIIIIIMYALGYINKNGKYILHFLRNLVISNYRVLISNCGSLLTNLFYQKTFS